MSRGSRIRYGRRVSASVTVAAQKGQRQKLIFGGLGATLVLVAVLVAVFLVRGGGPAIASDFPVSFYQGSNDLGSPRETNLDSLRGKPMVLNFWAAKCPPCRAEMPEFKGSMTSSKMRSISWALT